MTQEELKVYAKKRYLKNVKVEEYRNSFLKELDKRMVADKRTDGFRCGYCARFLEKAVAYANWNKVIFPTNNTTEIWIVNTHYDGCRGWD